VLHLDDKFLKCYRMQLQQIVPTNCMKHILVPSRFTGSCYLRLVKVRTVNIIGKQSDYLQCYDKAL